MIKSKPPLEKEIQASILDYLKLKRIFCWRNNSGMQFLPSANGKMRAIRIGLPGSADILGITNDGRFLAIEVKRPGGKARPEQQEFLDAISSRGGLAFVATSLDEVIGRI